MNKEPPRIKTREEWLAVAVKLYPHQTPEQHEQMWEAAQKAEQRRQQGFYERRASMARSDKEM